MSLGIVQLLETHSVLYKYSAFSACTCVRRLGILKEHHLHAGAGHGVLLEAYADYTMIPEGQRGQHVDKCLL